MKDQNIVALVGRLTRDAEAPQGNGPAHFSIAVSIPRKQGDAYVDEASFFDVEYWHRSILAFLKKGKQVSVSGYLKQDRWERDGQKHSRVVIVAQDLQLLGPREDQGAAQAAPARGTAAPAAAGGEQADFTDDIPF